MRISLKLTLADLGESFSCLTVKTGTLNVGNEKSIVVCYSSQYRNTARNFYFFSDDSGICVLSVQENQFWECSIGCGASSLLCVC